MDSKIPSVSIVLPTYNGAGMIGRAIESVLAQTHASWELLVVDDGSTDGTAALVQGFAANDARIRYLKNDTNMGIQKTLNKGLREARGTYVARIDDDDAWTDAGKLAAQHAHMLARPECVLVGTGVVVADEKGTELFRYLLPETDAEIRRKMLFRNCFTHSSVLFSREAAERAGGYSETSDTRHVEDYDLWLRLGREGTLANLPTYSMLFTAHAKSISSMNKLEQFRKDFALARKYRGSYPGYARAAFRWTALISLYGSFRLFPKKAQAALIGWDKKRS